MNMFACACVRCSSSARRVVHKRRSKRCDAVRSGRAAVAASLDDKGTSDGRPVLIDACHVCASVTSAELFAIGHADQGQCRRIPLHRLLVRSESHPANPQRLIYLLQPVNRAGRNGDGSRDWRASLRSSQAPQAFFLLRTRSHTHSGHTGSEAIAGLRRWRLPAMSEACRN